MITDAYSLAEKFGDVATSNYQWHVMAYLFVRPCQNRISVLMTLVFNTAQAALASKAGATYVSPFVGRIDDQGYAGLEVVRGIAGLYAQTGVLHKF